MRGLYAEAVEQCENALDAVREAGDEGAETFVLRQLGQLLLDVYHAGSIRPYQHDPEIGYRIGELLLASGRLNEAEQAFTDLLSAVTDLDDLRAEAYARYGLGYLHLERDRHAAGEEYLQQAIELSSAMGEPLIEVKAWLALGAASRSLGDYEVALHRFRRAKELAQAIGAPLWEARALLQVAVVHSERDCEASAAAARARLSELIAAIGALDSDIDAGVPSVQIP
nr:hypothetical protein [Nonomuraea polychroma]